MQKKYSDYYYKRKQIKIKANLKLLAVIGVICLTFCCILAFAMFNQSFNRKAVGFDGDIYMVRMSAFENLASATVFSESIRRKGGAGYILNDGKYGVFVAVYFDKDAALAVADGLQKSGERAEVIPYRLKPIISKKNEHGLLKDSVAGVQDCLNKVYELSNGLDSGKINQTDVRKELVGIVEKINGQLSYNILAENYNEILFKFSTKVSDYLLIADIQPRDLRLLNIELCFLFTPIML